MNNEALKNIAKGYFLKHKNVNKFLVTTDGTVYYESQKDSAETHAKSLGTKVETFERNVVLAAEIKAEKEQQEKVDKAQKAIEKRNKSIENATGLRTTANELKAKADETKQEADTKKANEAEEKAKAAELKADEAQVEAETAKKEAGITEE